jgi:4'-phosphopantetheinyl transferase EntD
MAVGMEAFDDVDGRTIFPSEARLVSNAVRKRQREFITGRVCAHRALSALGIAPSPVLSGERGEPVWPGGVVGSITHCDGYRACAVARKEEVASLGIDAEPSLPLPQGVLALISSLGERERLRELFAGDPGSHWDRLLFCAKEAVYKAWYPHTGISLAFSDAKIDFDPAGLRFYATMGSIGHGARPNATRAFSGRWRVERGLIVVTAWSSAPA